MSLPPAVVAEMEAHINDNLVPNIIAANSACIVVAVGAVALRLVARRLARSKIYLSDWLIIAALVLYVSFAITFCMTTRYGAGRHAILVTDPIALSKLNLSDEALYCSSLLLIKTSILSLYHSIFPQRWFKTLVSATGVFTICWWAACFFPSVFQCWPIAYQWDKTIEGHCIQYGTLVLAIGILNVVTDFWLLALPMPLIWGLHVSISKKWLISFALAAGSIACVISIVRLNYSLAVGASVDASWDSIKGGILSTVELAIGILAASFPTYAPLYNFVVTRDPKRSRMGGYSADSHELDSSKRSRNGYGHNTNISVKTNISAKKPPYDNPYTTLE